MHNLNKHMNVPFMCCHILYNSQSYLIEIYGSIFIMHINYEHLMLLLARKLLRLNAITPKDDFKVILSSQVTLVKYQSMILLTTTLIKSMRVGGTHYKRCSRLT